MILQLIAFVGVALAVICTPGPDTALTVRNASMGGRRSGMWTAGGVALGQVVWTVAASLGIAGLIRASEPVFFVMKMCGAAYLVYLGLQLVLTAHRSGTRSPGAVAGSRRSGRIRSLRQGMINDLANPKMAAFFSSLLPQFAPADSRALPVMLGLGLLFSFLTFAWLSLYSVAIAKLSTKIEQTRVRRVLDAVAGMFLVAFGIRVATSD